MKIPGPTRHLETEETVRYSDTDKPKGSETVTAEPNSTAPDLDSTRCPKPPCSSNRARQSAHFLAVSSYIKLGQRTDN